MAFVLSGAVDVPFWPQLPRRDFRETMVAQYARDFPGFTLDLAARRFRVERGEGFLDALTAFYERAMDPAAVFGLDRESAAGYFEFVERVRALPGKPRFVKGQVTGPITFALGLNGADGRPIHADGELREAAVRLLARIAAGQARALRPLASEGAIVFIDEPIFSALGTAAYLSVTPARVREGIDAVAEAIRGEGAVSGLHCCGNADWETVLSTGIDILSFDAWGYAEALALYAPQVDAFLDRGGRVAWGVVPTSDDLSSADERAVAARLDEAVGLLVAKGLGEEALRRASLVTPSCGLGLGTVADAGKAFRLLASAGRHARSRL